MLFDLEIRHEIADIEFILLMRLMLILTIKIVQNLNELNLVVIIRLRVS